MTARSAAAASSLVLAGTLALAAARASTRFRSKRRSSRRWTSRASSACSSRASSRRDRRRRREPRNGASAAKPAAHEVAAARHRSGSASARGNRDHRSVARQRQRHHQFVGGRHAGRTDSDGQHRQHARAQAADPKKAPEPAIKNEKDLAKFDKIFADVAYWKKLGEEYQSPLIVTGTVLFTPNQTSGFVMTNREVFDSLGRRSVVPVRTYMERKGFILQPRFVFIDGRTGAILYSETFHEEILYPQNQSVPALSTYFELMDRVIPSFLSTLSAQKIRARASSSSRTRPAASGTIVGA
jgi:hypothetical protein